MFSSSAIFPHQVLVTAHHVTMPRARSQQVLQKSSYAQATIEWPWSSSEFLFLLARALVDLAFFLLCVRISHEKPQLKRLSQSVQLLHFRQDYISQNLVETSLSPCLWQSFCYANNCCCVVEVLQNCLNCCGPLRLHETFSMAIIIRQIGWMPCSSPQTMSIS